MRTLNGVVVDATDVVLWLPRYVVSMNAETRFALATLLAAEGSSDKTCTRTRMIPESNSSELVMLSKASP